MRLMAAVSTTEFNFKVYLDNVYQTNVIALDTEQGWLLRWRNIRCPNNLEILYGTITVEQVTKDTTINDNTATTDNISK